MKEKQVKEFFTLLVACQLIDEVKEKSYPKEIFENKINMIYNRLLIQLEKIHNYDIFNYN